MRRRRKYSAQDRFKEVMKKFPPGSRVLVNVIGEHKVEQLLGTLLAWKEGMLGAAVVFDVPRSFFTCLRGDEDIPEKLQNDPEFRNRITYITFSRIKGLEENTVGRDGIGVITANKLEEPPLRQQPIRAHYADEEEFDDEDGRWYDGEDDDDF